MSPEPARAPSDPAEVVVGFLRDLEAEDVQAAMARMTDDAVWINVSLPTVRGRRRIERAVRALIRRGKFRHISTTSRPRATSS